MKTIIHGLDIACPRARVFTTLTTAEGLRSWRATDAAGDGGPGGRLTLMFGGDFSPVMDVTGDAAPDRVEWECTAGVAEGQGDRFSFGLEEHGTGTRLRFRQEYAAELSDDDDGIYTRTGASTWQHLKGEHVTTLLQVFGEIPDGPPVVTTYAPLA